MKVLFFSEFHSNGVTEKYWKNPGTGRYDADPGTGRVFIFIPVPVPAGMEVIPARYRPGQNFDPGRPLIVIFKQFKDNHHRGAFQLNKLPCNVIEHVTKFNNKLIYLKLDEKG